MRSLSVIHSKVSPEALAYNREKFGPLRARLKDAKTDLSYKGPFSFVSYLNDKKLIEGLSRLKEEKESPALKIVFVIGIGGANLGSKAVIDSLPKTSGSRTFVFLDTLYAGEEKDLKSIAGDLSSKDEFVILVISKSGRTLETLSNAQLLVKTLENKFGPLRERMVVISAFGSTLSHWARLEKVSYIETPADLTDRYAIFSPIGIFPLLFANISVEKLYEGALEALNSNLETSIGTAFQAACVLDFHTPKDKYTIVDLFYFGKQLETLGKWFRQLLAESVSKEETLDGDRLKRSVTPMVSVGTTDLHSMLQLYLSSPDERLTWFTTIGTDSKSQIGVSNDLNAFLPNISAKSPEHIVSVIYDSVTSVYKKRGVPYIETKLDTIDEYNLGFYMMTSILTTLGLATLWNVDAFNQPNVEEYKERTRQVLDIE